MTDVSELIPVILEPSEIAQLDWAPFPGDEQVEYKLLWQSGWSVAGIMKVPDGASLEAHTHRGAHHHLWVLSGAAEVMGRRLEAGSYVHVPAGVEHGISAVAPEGFEMLYLYLRSSDPGT
jgi:mannose-6-phosphate isomerase-like protein (cupin superfamily)